MTVTHYNYQQRFQQTADLHRANLLKTLERRLQVARAKGEQTLVRQLEAEKNYYLS